MVDSIQHKAKNKNTLIVYYQGFVAVAAVLVFFMRLDQYLEEHGIGLPLLWMMAFMFASVPLLGNILNKLHYIPMPIVVWCGIYLAMPLISILILPKYPDVQLLEDYIRSIIFLLLMLVIFSQHLLVLRWVKLTILLVTVTNVFMYVYEFFNPLAFYLEREASGRASGFYGNANAAGGAVILGMILTIDLIKPKYRLFYVLFAFLGIISTFSRGSIVSWFIVVLVFILTKVIPRYQIPLLFLSGFMIISILSTQLNNLKHLENADGTKLFTDNSLARIEFLIDPLDQEDNSKNGRLSHVNEAWEKFVRHPFIGNGLGSGQNARHLTEGEAQRSHNIYLDLMVEYGFLGALIYPCLLLFSVWKVQGKLKKQAIAFVCFSLIWGFFSHNVINSFSSLISYAFIANLAHQSRLKLL